MNDILLIDKPTGITSFDCIRILRKRLGIRKMGHAGTLDPMATGLMIIGVGEGTKELQEYLKLDKTYEAAIVLGVRTDTGDMTGKIQETGFGIQELKNISEEEIKKKLDGMFGKLELPVPAYSAIKRGGEALYKKARRGEHIDLPIKTMEVKSAEFLGIEQNRNLAFAHGREQMLKNKNEEGKEGVTVKVRFNVASGTYIRSLAEEFGRRLGVPAALASLRRTGIGEFKVENAQKMNPLP